MTDVASARAADWPRACPHSENARRPKRTAKAVDWIAAHPPIIEHLTGGPLHAIEVTPIGHVQQPTGQILRVPRAENGTVQSVAHQLSSRTDNVATNECQTCRRTFADHQSPRFDVTRYNQDIGAAVQPRQYRLIFDKCRENHSVPH